MTIIKNHGRMFDFITIKPNPIGGCHSGNRYEDEGYMHCFYNCNYCWAKELKNRRKYPKYEGAWRLYPKVMRKYNQKEFPFICDMIDVGDPSIPNEIIIAVLSWVAIQPCLVLLLTKNPEFYQKYVDHIPPNAVLGATIEFDTLDIRRPFTNAPCPTSRLRTMEWLKKILPENQRLICVEPIMKFTPRFADRIAEIDPTIIAVGYDSGNHNLDEPSLRSFKRLIYDLDEKTSATIYVKNIRNMVLNLEGPLDQFLEVVE